MEIVRDAYIKRNKQDMIPTRLQEAGCTEDEFQVLLSENLETAIEYYML